MGGKNKSFGNTHGKHAFHFFESELNGMFDRSSKFSKYFKCFIRRTVEHNTSFWCNVEDVDKHFRLLLNIRSICAGLSNM